MCNFVIPKYNANIVKVMKTTYQVKTGWSYLERSFRTLQEAKNYVEEIKKYEKKPRTAVIEKKLTEYQLVEKIEL